MIEFTQKVLRIVKGIEPGEFRTYKEIARRLGNERACRSIGNMLAKNRDPDIPCHRVIRNDGLVGGYLGKQNLSWRKLALLLKEGVAAVMPTDTIYGICGSALNEKTVEKIYRLRKRDLKKPMIVLISGLDDLKILGVKLSRKDQEILKAIWPAKISVVLECKNKKFGYLHRETKTLAFRIPQSKFLVKILKIAGPLVAPSANWEGDRPARTISEAKKYFGNKVVYYDAGKIIGRASTLIKLKNGKYEIIRMGPELNKLALLRKVELKQRRLGKART